MYIFCDFPLKNTMLDLIASMSVLISHNVIIKIQRGIGLGLPRLMEKR